MCIGMVELKMNDAHSNNDRVSSLLEEAGTKLKRPNLKKNNALP